MVKKILNRRTSKADIHRDLKQSFGPDIFHTGKDPTDDKTPILDESLTDDDEDKPAQPLPPVKANPLETAGWISKIFFCWCNAIVAKGYKKRLEIEDMYTVRHKDSSEVATAELEPYFDREFREPRPPGGKSPSLVKALIRCYGLRYGLLGIVYFIEHAVEFFEPLIIGYIIRYFQPNSGVAFSDVVMWAGILAAVDFADVIIGYYEWPIHLWGWHMDTALTNIFYKKCLRLSNGGLAKTSTGQIINILSEDVDSFEECFDAVHSLWMTPLETAGIMIFLHFYLGPAVWVGFAYMVLIYIVEAAMVPLNYKYGMLENVRGDARVDMMDEILRSIRVIKMQAWEKPFMDIIQRLRRLEMNAVLRGELVTGVSEILNWIGLEPVVFLIILTYVLTGNKLTAEKVFVMMAYLEMLEEAVDEFPEAIDHLVEAKVSVDRLERFFTLEEYKPKQLALTSSTDDLLPSKEEPKGVSVDITTAKYKKGAKGARSVILKNVQFQIGEGELIVVTGPTGSGKTALLCAVINELGHVGGKVDVRGTTAFTPQEAWIFPGTIRSNIVDFGKTFDQEKYDRALNVCKLDRDIRGMSHGDMTFIGDRGVTLSGGQRARLSLARAVYADADIYLLDDPLSAVDAEVGRKLFNRCIMGALGGKARILVTHQLQYLKKADKILVLEKGEQVAFGTYEEVAESGVDFTKLLSASSKDQDFIENEEGSLESIYSSMNSVIPVSQTGTTNLTKSTNFLEEEREGGSVNWRVYLRYLQAGPPAWCQLLMFFFMICFEALELTTDWWLAKWVDDIAGYKNTRPIVNGTSYQVSAFYLKVYGALEGSSIFFAIVSPILIVYACYISAINIHNMMFNSVIRAPLSFFDKNPSGRILNRFADDLEEVDEEIPEHFMETAETFLGAIGTVVMVCIVMPWALLPTIPVAIGFVLLYNYYIKTARHLARLDATTASPVYTHVAATVQGLWTIRAMSAQDSLKRGFQALIDRHNEVEFLHLGTESWYEVRTELLHTIYITAVTFFCIYSADSMGAGMVGLVLVYALSMSEHCEEIVESITEIEGAMIHAERVLEYADLEPEGPWETDHKPPPGWPQYGAINIDGLFLSYDDYGPPVLKNVNLNIIGGEKIGIVGRTGAGKSSLLMTLMRLVEPQEARITIDGVDIMKLGLHDLRKAISVIPQDPVMFDGTIRKNLDPLEIHSDHTLWTALDEVNMADDVKELTYRLATEMGKSGCNLSVGQKQLLCLARALMQNNRVLLVDEATANMDLRSDRMIQATIRERFKHCTILTIAHRLDTVIDSDRVVVMADGRVVEFDEPYVLLTNVEGAFSKLVSEVGPSMARELKEAAHKSYLQKRDQK